MTIKIEILSHEVIVVALDGTYIVECWTRGHDGTIEGLARATAWCYKWARYHAQG